MGVPTAVHRRGNTRGVVALCLASAAFVYAAMLFTLSRVVEAQGVPQDSDYGAGSVSNEAMLFGFVLLRGLIPHVAVGVAALVLALILRERPFPSASRRAALVTLLLLLVEIPLMVLAFRTWVGMGW